MIHNGDPVKKEGIFFMPRKALDLTGREFGRLTVIETIGKTKTGNYIWHCTCSCGGTKDVAAGNLNSNAIKSCGCLARERREERAAAKKEACFA